MTRLVLCSTLALGAITGAAHADVWIPFGTSSGGVAVYYNSAVENPSNVSYYRAQFNNSTTSLNGGAFSFANAPVNFASIFGDVGQHGLDLIAVAPTNTGSVPTLTAYDNTNNTIAGRSAAGSVAWAINNYYDSLQSPPPGPGNPAQSVVNSTIRGNGVTFTIGSVTPIFVGFSLVGYSASFSGTLVSDGAFHWYNPAFTDNAMSAYPDGLGNYLSGNFRFSGELTYMIGNDTTPGMDFYAGSVLIEAEVVPAPAAAALLGLGGLVAGRRRR